VGRPPSEEGRRRRKQGRAAAEKDGPRNRPGKKKVGRGTDPPSRNGNFLSARNSAPPAVAVPAAARRNPEIAAPRAKERQAARGNTALREKREITREGDSARPLLKTDEEEEPCEEDAENPPAHPGRETAGPQHPGKSLLPRQNLFDEGTDRSAEATRSTSAPVNRSGRIRISIYPGSGFPPAPRNGSIPGYARRNSFHAASASRYTAERTGGRAATFRASPSASAEGTSARSTAVMAYRSARKRLAPPDRSRERSATPRRQ